MAGRLVLSALRDGSPSPVGPWIYRGAILTSDEMYKGPGHHSFLYHLDRKRWYVFYHRWENVSGSGPYRGGRRVAVEPVDYEADGRIRPIKMTAAGALAVADEPRLDRE